MTFRLLHQGEFGMTVNGVDMLLGADTLQEATVIENSREGMPNVVVSFVDTRVFAKSNGLFQDGAPVNVTIGDGKISPVTYSMRHWSMEDAHPSSVGEAATIHGVADTVKWFAQNVSKYQEGNSHEVVKTLAGLGGIGQVLSEISTQDKMVHLPDGRTLAQFARKIVDHAWIGSGASPFMALTSVNGQWALRLSDIMKKGNPTLTLSSLGLMSQGDFPIWDHRVRTNGGPLNKWVNYGSKVVQEMLPGNPQIFKNVSFSQIATALGINSSLMSQLDVVRTLYHAVDSGNTHENHARALHENRRMRATYSTTLHVLTDQLSTLKLLDDVQVNLARPDGQKDGAFSGLYKVSALARHVSRGQFREKIELTSQGSSADPAGSSVVPGGSQFGADQALAIANVLTGGSLSAASNAAATLSQAAAAAPGLSRLATAAQNFSNVALRVSAASLGSVTSPASAASAASLTSATTALAGELQRASPALSGTLGSSAAPVALAASQLTNQLAPLAGGLSGISMGGQLQSALSSLTGQLGSVTSIAVNAAQLLNKSIAGVGDILGGASSVISGL